MIISSKRKDIQWTRVPCSLSHPSSWFKMVGLRLNSEIIGNFRNSEGFLEVFEILKVFGQNIFKGSCPSLRFKYFILRYLGPRTRLPTQNSSVRVIYEVKQNDQNFFQPLFRKFPRISELSLSPANSLTVKLWQSQLKGTAQRYKKWTVWIQWFIEFLKWDDEWKSGTI